MKIIFSESQDRINKVKGKKSSISAIVDNLLLLCKEDENFRSDTLTENSIVEVESIEKRIKKQDALLKQANEMREKITKRISSIDNDSFKIKVRLLEMLGSELWI